MHDPDAVKAILGAALPISRVLPWPTGEFLTFEWIGEEDYLGEARPGEARTRGSRATSADLAVRYRASSGDVEIALMEWKYVEGTYDPELGPGNEKRMARHRSRSVAPDGPVRQDMIGYPDLFVDPFYQLLRLTLLASAMEQAGEHGARTVRVILAAPARNEAFRHQLARESLRDLGFDVPTVWRRLPPVR